MFFPLSDPVFFISVSFIRLYQNMTSWNFALILFQKQYGEKGKCSRNAENLWILDSKGGIRYIDLYGVRKRIKSLTRTQFSGLRGQSVFGKFLTCGFFNLFKFFLNKIILKFRVLHFFSRGHEQNNFFLNKIILKFRVLYFFSRGREQNKFS
mgnify:CR=1 FL=1